VNDSYPRRDFLCPLLFAWVETIAPASMQGTRSKATLQLDEKPAEKITEVHLEGVGFTGASTGLIESPDAIRAGAKKLSLKLIPHEGMLVGRILATASKTVMLPLRSQLGSNISLNIVPGEIALVIEPRFDPGEKQETLTLRSKRRLGP
jgi:hypothetical protein